MIKRLVLPVIILVLTLATPVLAAEPNNGTMEGLLVNGTKDGSSVANQEVTLKTFRNDAEVNSSTTKTDAEGYFVFKGLSTEPDYSYQVTLTFQQAEYSSDRLSFKEGETSKFAEVMVYDATTSDEAIKVMTAHTVIYLEQGGLSVVEYLLFANESDRTYIGLRVIDQEGRRETLRFSLPKEAIELQPGDGLMECCIFGSEAGFIDTMPVLPGGREIVYSYRVENDSGEYTFSRKVNYPTINYNFLVQGEGVKLTSDLLVAEEPLNIEGVQFSHLSGRNLKASDILLANIAGLPETGSQASLIWVAITLAVLTFGFSFGYLRKGRKLQPVKVDSSPEQKTQRALIELAQLDDDFAAGKINEESYRRLRAQKKSQLIALIKRTKE